MAFAHSAQAGGNTRCACAMIRIAIRRKPQRPSVIWGLRRSRSAPARPNLPAAPWQVRCRPRSIYRHGVAAALAPMTLPTWNPEGLARKGASKSDIGSRTLARYLLRDRIHGAISEAAPAKPQAVPMSGRRAVGADSSSTKSTYIEKKVNLWSFTY